MKLFSKAAAVHARGPAADAYVRAWLNEVAERVAGVIVVAALGWAALFLLFLPFLIAPGAFRWLAIAGNLTTIVVSGLMLLARQRGRSIVLPVVLFGLAMQLASCSLLAAMIKAETLHGWIWPFALAATTVALCMSAPVDRWRGKLVTMIYAATFAYGIAPLGVGRETMTVIVILTWILISLRVFWERFLDEVARQEYAIEALAALAERRKVEQELEVARRIQESLTSTDAVAAPGGLTVSWYQSKIGKVGGDWVVSRVLGDDRIVTMVVDATGKGVQAALVVHAVQSLWADSLGSPTFDPEAWIVRVNATLLRLGKREPHSMTMGVLLVGGGRVEYWSAGHLPVFLARALDAPEQVQTLVAGGSPLGLGPLPKMTPAAAALPAGEVHILLGSDGVFTKGTRMRRGDILEILKDLQAGGTAAMLQGDQTDDQTLVWLRRAA